MAFLFRSSFLFIIEKIKNGFFNHHRIIKVLKFEMKIIMGPTGLSYRCKQVQDGMCKPNCNDYSKTLVMSKVSGFYL